MNLDEDSTIKTEIESDIAYRERLKQTDPSNKVVHSIIDIAGGGALDIIGANYKLYRCHRHICSPINEPVR
jgi:hypothetical protein